MSPTALRSLTALVLLAGLLAVLFLMPGWVWMLVVAALTGVAADEWGRLCRWPSSPRRLFAAGVVVGALGVALVGRHGGWLDVPVMAAAGLFWLVAVPIWLVRAWTGAGLRGIAGALVLLPLAWALLWLHQQPHGAWLLLVGMGFVWVADSCAYFVGRAYGRRRLAPAVSPGKTWEGVAGALAGTLLYAAALVAVAGGVELVWLLPLAFVLTALAVVGDLYESWMKRLGGVKDSGAWLPGHGGLLDRIDGLAAALPAWAAALWLAGWGG